MFEEVWQWLLQFAQQTGKMSEGSSEHSLHEEIGYRVSFGAKTFSTQKSIILPKDFVLQFPRGYFLFEIGQKRDIYQ